MSPQHVLWQHDLFITEYPGCLNYWHGRTPCSMILACSHDVGRDRAR